MTIKRSCVFFLEHLLGIQEFGNVASSSEFLGAAILVLLVPEEMMVLDNHIILLLLLLLLLTAIELSLGGSSPYTSTDKTNKNKYT